MNPEPCAVAPAFGARGHISRDVKCSEPIPNTVLVDAEDYEIFGLHVVNVRNGGNSECAAFGIGFIDRVELSGGLVRAGPVPLTNVSTRR
jgi:hypothetical protein